jgi:hypothetical protein
MPISESRLRTMSREAVGAARLLGGLPGSGQRAPNQTNHKTRSRAAASAAGLAATALCVITAARPLGTASGTIRIL